MRAERRYLRVAQAGGPFLCYLHLLAGLLSVT
jgi:hypothetical protein